ncbi:hypothetical protein V1521DRAFT_441612 [Lipomyces starkeyi]
MAKYEYCWILDGTVGAKLAGQRRIKLDIEQTWNAETGFFVLIWKELEETGINADPSNSYAHEST